MKQTIQCKKTALYSFHRTQGHMDRYADFEMPMWFKGAIEEHLSVRNSCGIFDVSHMGRLIVAGMKAARYLDGLLTENCTNLHLLVARQAFLCNPSGGIIDDIMLFRLGTDRFFLIINANNVKKDLEWMEQHLRQSVEVTDVTDNVPMIAVQGPNALELLQKLTTTNLSSMQRLHANWVTMLGRQVLVSRTGYTGEDGFEIYAFQGDEAKEYVIDLWKKILQIGEEYKIEPCGLVSRDTLRVEAGFCLNGNELGEDVTPLEAGLDYGVKFDDRDFIGKEALFNQSEVGVNRIRIGFRMSAKGIPRKGMELVNSTGGETIGLVTSGTYSPLLKTGIGMGFVPLTYNTVGQKITIKIRGRKVGAEVVKTPFYDEARYGWRRKCQ